MPELLTNLKIIGTEKPADSLTLQVPSVFEVMFNPNSYTINNKINFDKIL